MLEAVPCRVHTVLTDTGIPFAKQPRNIVQSRPMRFDMICEANGIEHRLTKPPPVDQRPGRAHQPHDQGSNGEALSFRRP